MKEYYERQIELRLFWLKHNSKSHPNYLVIDNERRYFVRKLIELEENGYES